MRTKTIEVFKVDELTEKAQERAYYKWLEGRGYDYGEENEKTLAEFENIFPITVNGWEYDQYSSNVSFSFNEEDTIEELSGLRLAKYIYNNYWDQITTGRYYSLWSKKDQNPHYREGGHAPQGKLKSRHSKIMIVEPSSGACPLTGYYMDEEILDPIFDFLKAPTEGTDFSDLMEQCLDKWGKACSSDYEATTSMEYFKEDAEVNEYEYTEDGEMI